MFHEQIAEWVSREFSGLMNGAFPEKHSVTIL
jgi:hypothetical protein